MNRIYFDISATTPIDPKVMDLMNDLQKRNFGNPSSIHREGQSSKVIIEKSRHQIANSLNCSNEEIIFTSSGTEANNMVLKGVLQKGDHFITTTYEHPAILKVIPSLIEIGIEISYLKPDKDGIIQIEELKNNIKDNTKLVSIMYVNNELGTINPIEEFSIFCFENNILFHSDAVQAFGKIPINMKNLYINFLSMSAHKLYGPKGVGALYVKKGTKINPLIFGGGQESNLRGSTENIIGISGFGLAAEIASKNMEINYPYIKNLGKYLLTLLDKNNISYKINGKKCIPGVFNMTFPLIDGKDLVMQLDIAGIAISFGAACASGTTNSSNMLTQLGLSNKDANSTVRISIGKIHTKNDVENFITNIHSIIKNYKR